MIEGALILMDERRKGNLFGIYVSYSVQDTRLRLMLLKIHNFLQDFT